MNKQTELAKNTIVLTIGKICTQFMSFLLMPLYTAVLSTEEYGTVDILLTYTALLLPIVIFQVDQAIFRFLVDVRNQKDKCDRIISTSFLFAFFQMIIATGIFSVVQIFVDSEVKWFLLFNILASIISNIMLQVVRGLGDNVTYAIGSFIAAVVQILGNIVFLVCFNWGVEGMLAATVLGQLVSAGVIFIKNKLYKYINLQSFDKTQLRVLLKYSIPLIPNALCWWALNASDRTIVMGFLGASANGLLSVGHKFSSIYITVYNIFNMSWTESAALHMNDEDRDEFFTSVITNMFKFFMCVGLGVIAIMPFVFPVFVNQKFDGSYGLIPVFVLASMMNVVVGLYSVIYVALKKTGEIAKTSFYTAIINIGTHLALIKFIGIYAAPVSSVIAFAAMAIYRYFDLKKYVNVPLKKRLILLFTVLFVVVFFVYMSRIMWLQLIVLFMIAIFSLWFNRKIMKQLYSAVIKKIKKN